MDYIIIGAGITGLYAGYLLENSLILEKDDHIGGRIQQTKFHGSTVQLGAGVIRDTDKHLLQLVKKLKLKYFTFESEYLYNIPNFDKNWYNKHVKELKIIENQSMKETLQKHFKYDTKKVNLFIQSYNYTDYLKADTNKTLTHYPRNEFYIKKKTYHMLEEGFYTIIKELAKYSKIKKNTTVESILLDNNGQWIVTTNNGIYHAKHVICAIDLIGLKNIKFDKSITCVKYMKNYIRGNNFIRIYTYHDEMSIPNSILTNTILKQIIPISNKVVMSGYSDNENASKLLKISDDNKKLFKLINKSVKNFGMVSKIKDKIIQYWNVGTHYYKPGYTNKCNYFSEKNVHFIGEMVAFNQGWVDGAIFSVNNLIKNI